MDRTNMCYYESDVGICENQGECPHRDKLGICVATDEELLTYEDYLQERAIRLSTQTTNPDTDEEVHRRG